MSVRRPLLLPLVPLYRAGLWLRNRRYDNGGTRALRGTVVSVGSLSAGGAGKTPFSLALARLLQGMGQPVDVLSRGYGRSTRGVLRVDPAGTARSFGDEPLMLARTLGVPVFVGSSRFAAGQMAEGGTGPGRVRLLGRDHIHLMDDGFGHRALARQLDIVLLTAEDVSDRLLPAGNLREPLGALRRADVIVLRDEEAELLGPVVRKLMGAATPVWTVKRRVVLSQLCPPRPLVFSAIARPADFEAMLRAEGVRPARVERFRDHHPYRAGDVAKLVRLAHAAGADGFVATAKDAVKLDGRMLAELRGVGPVAVADAAVEFTEPERAIADLLRMLPGMVPGMVPGRGDCDVR